MTTFAARKRAVKVKGVYEKKKRKNIFHKSLSETKT